MHSQELHTQLSVTIYVGLLPQCTHDLLEKHLINANMVRCIKHVSCADPQICKDR